MTEKLFEQICDWSNILDAYENASRGKRGRAPAAAFEYRLEDNLITLQAELKEKRYKPSLYTSFYVHDPKKRLISAAPFRDRVVHHALCNVIQPILERSFIHDTYANRIGKGTHRAIARAQEFARRFKYVLPCDIRQYFPSIDHAILGKILAKKIKDPDTLWLIERIIKSGVGVLSESYDMVYFPGDDLFAINRPRGLPIGNLTSQFWANCYLDGFDHFVKRELRCRGYVRYVDDILLFGDRKSELWEWKTAIIGRLAALRLKLHENRAQVRPVGDGIPFLGFVVFRNKRRLKRRKGIAFRRKLRGLTRRYAKGEISNEQVADSVNGWMNHAAHGNTLGLRMAVVLPEIAPFVADSGMEGRDGGYAVVYENL